MLIMTANLLAEKPYGKYCKTERIDFPTRKARFLELVRTTHPDLLLFQEVDGAWNEVLTSHLSAMGYETAFGECWSSGLAISWHGNAFRDSKVLPSNADAGLLIGSLACTKTGNALHVVNLHAPWGKAIQHAETYRGLLPAQGAMVVAGDFNTDNPAVNNNEMFLMSQLFASDDLFTEATQAIAMTARNVNSNHPEKLDYIVTRGLKSRAVNVVPSELELLLPHNPGAPFAAQNSLNHYSDHAAVFAELEW
ncbi:MAG: endonuclease/exonuclease/phosphatase family protein [Bacteroidota bacterium]